MLPVFYFQSCPCCGGTVAITYFDPMQFSCLRCRVTLTPTTSPSTASLQTLFTSSSPHTTVQPQQQKEKHV